MKFKFCSNKESLIKTVPNRYRSKAVIVPKDKAPYSLVILKDSVALSRIVKKAISSAKKDSTLVIVVEQSHSRSH